MNKNINYDLKIIKKKYGENMSILCRQLFPTLLEKDGVLSQLIINQFSANHFLYNDLIKYDKVDDFCDYI